LGDWRIGRLRIQHLWVLAAACSLFPVASAQRADEVSVPAGTFTMGTDDGRIDALMARFGSKRREIFASEVPARAAAVRAFFIDRTEVTSAAFKTFVDAHQEWSRERLAADRHNGEYLKTWAGGSYPAGEGDMPVTFITWHAASAYCESVGKRLPTETEWEYAAGRGRAAEFPWGDDPPDAKANWSGAKLGKPSTVGAFPPAHGLFDMAGNVWEFVSDAWKDSYLDAAKVSPGRRVIRGGSFGGSPVNLRVRYRDSHPELGAGPHVGFRCARSAAK
jgi:formylglycine-generating enzyme required for sulfatase activity